MKKIAIATWYTYQNFGTALQAAALNKVIRNMGFEAYDIAYDPVPRQKILGGMSRTFAQRVRSKISRTFVSKPVSGMKRDRLFRSFVENSIPTTHSVNSDEDFVSLNDDYDAFVCGSDQIWSPRSFDPRYYLDFVNDNNKKIAYAPSFGCDNLDNVSVQAAISDLLVDFAQLSVREESGAKIVRALTRRDPELVLDPTLLLSDNEWSEYATSFDVKAEPYCLFYFLGKDSVNKAAAVEIARRKGLRIIVIPVFFRDLKSSNSTGIEVGPAEFLALFQKASLICTDSFHGMVFSTIFRHDFVAFERFDPLDSESQNTRVYSFLKIAGLGESLLSRREISTKELFSVNRVDFDKVDSKIEALRQKSLLYLETSLNAAISI